MGGYVAHDAVASATRSPLSLKRHSMLTWTEKGERLDAEMHSIHLFSDAYTRQVEALTQKSPFRRLIQSTHTRPTTEKRTCCTTVLGTTVCAYRSMIATSTISQPIMMRPIAAERHTAHSRWMNCVAAASSIPPPTTMVSI